MDEHTVYLEAIRTHVCSICQHATPQNTCGVTSSERCAVERFLPQIVEVAARVNSERIDDYVTALRDTVCRICQGDDEDGCADRDTGICGLDRYFVLIIEAIEQVILQQRKAGTATAAGG